MAIELIADDLTDLPAFHHFMNLLHAGPLNTIGFTGQQNDFGQRRGPLDAVEIIVGIPVPIGADELKLILLRLDTRLFKEFPGDSLAAGLSSLGCATGILPGACKTLARCPAGQQQIALSVVHPDTYHKAEFTRLPAASPAMNSAGQISVLVINIIKFHRAHPLTLPPTLYHIFQKNATRIELYKAKGPPEISIRRTLSFFIS